MSVEKFSVDDSEDELENDRTIRKNAESLPPSAIPGYENLTPRERICLDLIANNPKKDLNSIAEGEPVSEETISKVEGEHGDMVSERINELENGRVSRERGNVSFEGEPLDLTMKHLSEIHADPFDEHNIDKEQLTEKEKSILRMALRLNSDCYSHVHKRLELHGHHMDYSHVRKTIKKYLEPDDESKSKAESYLDLGTKQQLAVDLLTEYYGNGTDESLYKFYQRKAKDHDLSHGTLYNVNNDFQHIIWKWMDEE